MSRPKLELLMVADNGGQWDPAESVLEVFTPHALSQAVGYVKFCLKEEFVFFRGQTKLHTAMRPSLFRSAKNWSGVYRRIEALNILIKKFRAQGAFISGTPDYAHDALLQHYGIRTRWLDLVDNVWVALWFACHEAKTAGKHHEYLHFTPRRSGFAYIPIVSVGVLQNDANMPGVSRSPDAEVIDLRRAAPSLYLRPHAQHGVLFRPRQCSTFSDIELAHYVVGTIKVHVETGLKWLGEGILANAHHFFPSPLYDFGYERLLKYAPPGTNFLGALQHVGA